MSAFTVLIVCTGNICRSPFAERMLRDRLAREGIDASVRSAGTHAVVGASMQETAAAELALRGGSAEGFRARQLDESLLEHADLVLTMTLDQRSQVLAVHPRALRRAFTLTEFALLLEGMATDVDGVGVRAGAEVRAGADSRDVLSEVVAAVAARRSRLAGTDVDRLDIDDPYGLDEVAYRRMADDVSQAVDAVARGLACLLSTRTVG